MRAAIKERKGFNIINVVIFLTAFLIFVFPNSFRSVKMPLLLLLFLVGITSVRHLNKFVFFSLISSFFITITYLIIGLPSSAFPDEAMSQTLIVYIFTPLLWVVVLNYCFERFYLNTIIKYLNIFMVLGCFSVFIAIWLFNNGQTKILELIIEDPNMTFSDKGIVEMKLFVYGSLIFFIPAFFQLESFYKVKWSYFIIILITFLAAVVSGRSALLLSVFIGLSFYLFANPSLKIFKYILFGVILLTTSIFILESFGVNILNIFEEFYKKIFEGGDKERPEQTAALLNGINNHIFGAGHGVGVDYIRSYKFPWRYENVPFALIYKVGIFGFIIYSLPFLYTVYAYLKLKNRKAIDHYMLIGLVSILIATFTNPYLESFEFNIFYVLPFVYFIKRDRILWEK
ncbi:hypothetical protein ACR780_04770 [Sphingobacterium faecium]|uniref:hypothetical protein n=1 Tax=Sphingobacterium faecium TaxID=34087 RepID=UPI003DA5B02D